MTLPFSVDFTNLMIRLYQRSSWGHSFKIYMLNRSFSQDALIRKWVMSYWQWLEAPVYFIRDRTFSAKSPLAKLKMRRFRFVQDPQGKPCLFYYNWSKYHMAITGETLVWYLGQLQSQWGIRTTVEKTKDSSYGLCHVWCSWTCLPTCSFIVYRTSFKYTGAFMPLQMQFLKNLPVSNVITVKIQ